MNNREAIQAHLNNNPGDMTARHVMADLHEEEGRPRHAEVWRHFADMSPEGVTNRAVAATRRAFEGRHAGDFSPEEMATDVHSAPHPERAAWRHLNTAADHIRFTRTYDMEPDERQGHLEAARLHTEAAYALSPHHAAVRESRKLGMDAPQGWKNYSDHHRSYAESHENEVPREEGRGRRRNVMYDEEDYRLGRQHKKAAQLHREVAEYYSHPGAEA